MNQTLEWWATLSLKHTSENESHIRRENRGVTTLRHVWMTLLHFPPLNSSPPHYARLLQIQIWLPLGHEWGLEIYCRAWKHLLQPAEVNPVGANTKTTPRKPPAHDDACTWSLWNCFPTNGYDASHRPRQQAVRSSASSPLLSRRCLSVLPATHLPICRLNPSQALQRRTAYHVLKITFYIQPIHLEMI